MNISRHTRTRGVVSTPQSQPIPGREQDQVLNSAGGFVFSLDRWKRLERFLILGTEGGTYYVGEKDLTKENHENLLACIAEKADVVVSMATDISINNRAPKNDFAIYALAMVAAKADEANRKLAFLMMPQVCRIGTHLFQFAQFYTAFRGWSRMARTGVAKWYTERSDSSLALQLVKYQQRNGWAHRDLLRLCHVKPKSEVQAAAFKWAVDGTLPAQGLSTPGQEIGTSNGLGQIFAHHAIHSAGLSTEDALVAIKLHRLTAEMLPTELLAKSETWEAMLPHLGLTAILRNLARMTASGLLARFSMSLVPLAARLLDAEALRAARVHPFTILQALTTYQQGHGERGKLTWEPNPHVVDIVSQALELSFTTVEPTGKRVLHALDISGSMSSPIMGSPISCRMAECVMALATLRSEPSAEIVAFDYPIRQLPFSYATSLSDAVKLASGWTGGRTDCAQPMLYAMQQGWTIDAFVLWTDNETGAGAIHPIQALAQYRARFNPAAKLVVCGMWASSGFSIADPKDPGTLDIVGMDSSVPQVLASMLRD